MLFASNKRKNRKLSRRASTEYTSLEARNMLTLIPPPAMTTDVGEFAATVDNAVVRVDDSDRLIIRTTGSENRIDLRLEFGYLQVNRENYFSLALEIDPAQYESILLLSGGDDSVRVSGTEMTAQMHPDRLWVSAESNPVGKQASPLQIHGSDFEYVEINDSAIRDFGPYVHQGSNRIRMYGSDGVDRLDMSSDNSFAIRTSASLTGEGYSYSVNNFADLYVAGGGGDDTASIAGSRGFEADGGIVDGPITDGNDIYVGRDNWSRVRNDLWDARIVDFETQRIDLLSGDDEVIIQDTGRPASYYRVDGSDLVGAYRRIIGVERVNVEGSLASTEVLRRPQSDEGALTEETDRMVWSNVDPVVTPEDPYYPTQILPDYFQWKFTGFDRLA